MCGISYYPNKQPVKRPNKFDTPKGSDPDGKSKVPPVAMIDDTPKLSGSVSNLPSSIKALKRPGVNITSFHSTVDDESL
jgi:hypothetical protein